MVALRSVLATFLSFTLVSANVETLHSVASVGSNDIIGDGRIFSDDVSAMDVGGNGFGAGLSGTAVVGDTPNGIGPGMGGSPTLVVSDLDFNGNGMVPGAGMPMEGDLSLMVGGDTVDVDAFIPASGAGGIGMGGMSGFGAMSNGVGGGLVNVGDNIGDFGFGGNGGGMMPISGPMGLDNGGMSLGSPVSIDAPAGGNMGVQTGMNTLDSGAGFGFSDFGFDSTNPFSDQLGMQPGPWNMNAWGMQGAGQLTDLGVGGGQFSSLGFGGGQLLGPGWGGGPLLGEDQFPSFGVGGQVPDLNFGGSQLSGPGVGGGQLPGPGLRGGQLTGPDGAGGQLLGLGAGSGQLPGLAVGGGQLPGLGFGGSQLMGPGVGDVQLPGPGLGRGPGVTGGQLLGPGVGGGQLPGLDFGPLMGPGVGRGWLPGRGVGRGGGSGFPGTLRRPLLRSTAGIISNRRTGGPMRRGFFAGFGDRNIGRLDSTVVIRDADTAFVSTGPAGSGPRSMLPSLASPRSFVNSRMQRRLPFRPMPPRLIPGGSPVSRLFGPGGRPFSRPLLRSMASRRQMVGPGAIIGRPFFNFRPRMGPSLRGMPFRYNFGLNGVRGPFRYRVLPRTPRIPTVSNYGRSRLVPGKKGYSQYYRNKYMPRRPVIRRRSPFPKRRNYRKYSVRRITTGKRQYKSGKRPY